MYSKNEIIIYLNSKKQYFLDNYHLLKIGFFGSYSRNNQNPGSELDIILEFEPGTQDLFELKNKLKNEIRKDLKIKVDICREKYLNSNFKEFIMNDVVYV